ncbi:hypothetical protein [uncultured Tateyamaria sp.]|nr:hypothetical protein [uncultured Tateyamaria sp.]
MIRFFTMHIAMIVAFRETIHQLAQDFAPMRDPTRKSGKYDLRIVRDA